MISVWPRSDAWIEETVRDAARDNGAWRRLRVEARRTTVVATILPPGYPMKDMYYDGDPDGMETDPLTAGIDLPLLYRLIAMGRPPQPQDTVQVVFSLASKAWKRQLAPAEALDPGVQLTPVVVVDIIPSNKEIVGVRYPQPRNAWGPDVVMPLF